VIPKSKPVRRPRGQQTESSRRDGAGAENVKPQGHGGMWPAHLHPCVWMDAGVITYRLCDRFFDCDRCPLDAALVGKSVRATEMVGPSGGVEMPQPATFPTDRHYSPKHTWALRLADGDIRIGVDSFAAGLLRGAECIHLAQEGDWIKPADVAADVDLCGGTIAITSPLGGRVSRRNERLRHHPESLVKSPYDEGWLLDMSADPLQLATLPVAEMFTGQAEYDLQRFRRQAAFYLWEGQSQLGEVMADGGTPLTDLREILGPGRYLSLVRSLIG
jgi:glycine cleavage system H protein